MTERMSIDGWTVFVLGLGSLIIGTLPMIDFVASQRAILVGVSGAIMFLSSLYMTEDVAELEAGLEIKKEVSSD
jgi:hypothetical protein